MKKGLAVLCALLLALTVCPAVAAGAQDGALMLVAREGGAEKTVGMAVMISSGGSRALVTANGAVAEGSDLWLVSYAGERWQVTEAARLGDSGLTVLLMPDGLARVDTGLSAGRGTRCTGVTRGGAWVTAPLRRYSSAGAGVFLTTSEDLLPGAAVLDAGGAVAAIVTAEWGEGKGNYYALPAAAVEAALSNPSLQAVRLGTDAERQNPDGATVTLENVALTWSEGMIHIDWSASTIPDWTDDSRLLITVICGVNPYYTCYEPASGSTTYDVPGVPGLTYYIFVEHVHGESKGVTDLENYPYASITIPQAVPMTRFGYADEVWLAVTEPNAAVGDTERLPRAATLSAADLDRGCTPWMQVDCRYTVSEDMQENLLTVLVSPEGIVMFERAWFVYGTEYMAEDVWHTDMSKMFAELKEFNHGLTEGLYTVTYYINGEQCGTAQFELTK